MTEPSEQKAQAASTAPPPASRLARLRARGPALLALLMAVVGVLLSAQPTPLWWFGSTLLVVSMVLAARIYRDGLLERYRALERPRNVFGITVKPTRAFYDVLYVSLLVFVGTVMMADIVGGERPVSHDHTVHYFKAWQLHEHFLSEGRLLGWSHRWFAGYPAQYLYPIGADLWVNAVHALFMGALSFSQAYAVAFWFFHLFTGLAAYRFGRMIGGPHVGAIAGLLMLTDLSEFRMGGWAYTIEYGVWPQALSLSFALMALSSMPAIARERRLAPVGVFALWMGLAILTHPAQLIFIVLLLVVTALAAGFADGVRAPSAMLRLVLGSVLALPVAAAWLLPFLSAREETSVMGVWWATTYELAQGLIDLGAFPGTLGWVLAAGCFALVVMLRTRQFRLLLCALMALLIPAVCNSTFVDEFHLADVSTAFSRVQFLRMSTMAKPVWSVLAGYFVVAALARARQLALSARAHRPRHESLARAGALAAVVALLTAPVVVEMGGAFWTRHVRKSMVTESDREYVDDRRELVAWLKKNLPRDGFYRLGVFTGHNHDLMDLGAILDIPIFKRGFTPCSNFVYKMRDKDRAILEAVNLRFAIAKKHLSGSNFELVKRFGKYRLYRFKHYRPEPYSIIEGDGQVSVQRWDDEDIRFTAGAGSTGRIRLNVSYFSRWQAYRDGEPLEMGITYLSEAPDDTGFITLPLSPGQYRLVFERTAADRLALPITVAGLFLCALLVVGDRRRRGIAMLWRAIDSLCDRLDLVSSARFAGLRRVALGVLAVTVLALGVALAIWRPVIEADELSTLNVRRVRYDLLENLWKASANIEYRHRNQPCLRVGERLVCRDAEGNLDNQRYIASTPATIKEYTMVRCIRARPERDALLSVTFPNVPVGDAIIGYYGIERAGRLMTKRRPVEVQVLINGEPRYKDETKGDNRMHYYQIPLHRVPGRRMNVSFSVRADNVRKRFFCFHGQVVDLE